MGSHRLEEGFVLKRIRAKFIKGESLKFLSHLDILRTFGRALRRGNINVAYSRGFNPHQAISFALPLPVGTTSQCEYVDFDFEEDILIDTFINNINRALPDDLKVLEAFDTDITSNIMAIITSAKYSVKVYSQEYIDISRKLYDFLAMDQILIEKKTKSGVKEVDIKDKIKDLKQIGNAKYLELYMYLDSGSVSNLKPETVLASMYKYLQINIEDFHVHRLELFY